MAAATDPRNTTRRRAARVAAGGRTPADRGRFSAPRATVRGAAAGLFFGGLCCLYALVPPSPDQFELTYVAWRLNAGAAPYAGVIDMNWPGAFWLHQLIAWLPQGPLYPWRVLDFVLMLAGVAATARWIDRDFGRPAAVAVVLGYPLLYAAPGWYWFSGQRDAVCFHLVLLAAACQMASLRTPRGSLDAASGALIAFATLVKPVALVAAPALLTHALLTGRELRPGLSRFTWNAAGGLGLWAAAAAGLALQGAPWAETIDAAWTYNRIGQRDNHLLLGGLAAIAWEHAAGWVVLGPVALLGLVAAAARGPRRGVLLAIALTPASLIFYAAQGKGFVYHLAWVQGIVWIAALATAGVALGVAWRGFARGRRAVPRPVSVAALALFLLAAASVAAKSRGYAGPLALIAGGRDRPTFLEAFNAGPGTTFAEAEAAVAEAAASVGVDEPLLVFGDATSINLMADRPLPTAFYYPRVLTAMHRGGPAGEDLARRWDARFAAELNAADPPLVFVGERVLGEMREADAPAAAVLRRWLEERYRPAGRIGGLLRYRPH